MANEGIDPQLTIKTRVDATGVAPGVGTTVEGINQVKDATGAAGNAAESAAPKLGKMVEEAGGMRESQRLARELFEALRGGDESIAGLSGILRYALISSEALSAAGPVGMAIAALGTSFISLWALHAAKSSEAKDKIKTDMDETKTYLESALKEIADGKFWGEELSQAQSVTKELDSQLAAYKMIQQAKDALESAKLGLAEAGIDQREEAALKGKSPEEQEQIRAQFDLEKDQVRNKFETDNAQSEVQTNELELKNLQQKKADQLAEIAAAQNDLARTSQNLNEARMALVNEQSDWEQARDTVARLEKQKADAAAGIEDPDTGEAVQPLTPDQEATLESLKPILESLRQKEDDGPQFTRRINDAKADEAAQNEIEQKALASGDSTGAAAARAKMNADVDFILKAEKYQNLQKQQQEAVDALAKVSGKFNDGLTVLTAQINDAATAVQTALIKLQTAQIAGPTKTDADQAKLDLENAKAAFAARDAQRYADKKAADDDANNPLLTPDARAAAKARADAIEAAGIKDKLDNAQALGLGPDDVKKLQADYKSDQQAAVDAMTGQQQKDQSAQLKTSLERLKSLSDKPFMDHVDSLLSTVNTVADKQAIVNEAFIQVLANHGEQLRQHSTRLDDHASQIKHIK